MAYKQETEADFKVIGGQKYLANVVDGKHDTCFTEEGHRNLPLTVHIAGRAWAHAITLLLYDDFVASGNGVLYSHPGRTVQLIKHFCLNSILISTLYFVVSVGKFHRRDAG